MTERRKARILMDPLGSAWWMEALEWVAAVKVWVTVQAREDRAGDSFKL